MTIIVVVLFVFLVIVAWMVQYCQAIDRKINESMLSSQRTYEHLSNCIDAVHKSLQKVEPTSVEKQIDDLAVTIADDIRKTENVEEVNEIGDDIRLRPEALYGKNYDQIPYEETLTFPVIGNDGFPVGIILPKELVLCAKAYFGMTDFAQPVSYDRFREFLTKYKIKVGRFKFPEPAVEAKTPNHHMNREDPNKVWIGLEGNRKVIRYMTEDGLVEKLARHEVLYNSYNKRFSTMRHIPNGEQFTQWYMEAVDEIIHLDEVLK